MSDEIADELIGIQLGDQRLNERSAAIIVALAQRPLASINAACQGWGETAAAYRFFDNDKVTPEKILAPHRQATLARIQQQPVVLIAQDTTELDQTARPHTQIISVADREADTYDILLDSQQRLPLAEQPSAPLKKRGTKPAEPAAPVSTPPTRQALAGSRVTPTNAASYAVTLASNSTHSPVSCVPLTGQPGADYIIRACVDRCTLQPNPCEGAAA